jgi:steroid delta-isomerase-like uncharacterized protein
MGSSDTHRELHELFNRRDFDAITSRFAADAVYTDHANALTVTGGDQFRKWLDGWTAAMSDARVTEPRYLDAGDTSIAFFVGKGTNDGRYGTMPASGKPVSFAACETLTFDRTGMVVAGAMYFDRLTILTQTGAMERQGV